MVLSEYFVLFAFDYANWLVIHRPRWCQSGPHDFVG